MRNDARVELVTDALEMALWRRKPAPGVVDHSDRGCSRHPWGPTKSQDFVLRVRSCGSELVCGRRGSCHPWAGGGTPTTTRCVRPSSLSVEREVLDRYRFQTREEARPVLFAYLEAFHNRRRRHSALGYLSPAEFERRWLSGHESLSPTLSTKAG